MEAQIQRQRLLRKALRCLKLWSLNASDVIESRDQGIRARGLLGLVRFQQEATLQYHAIYFNIVYRLGLESVEDQAICLHHFLSCISPTFALATCHSTHHWVHLGNRTQKLLQWSASALVEGVNGSWVACNTKVQEKNHCAYSQLRHATSPFG